MAKSSKGNRNQVYGNSKKNKKRDECDMLTLPVGGMGLRISKKGIGRVLANLRD